MSGFEWYIAIALAAIVYSLIVAVFRLGELALHVSALGGQVASLRGDAQPDLNSLFQTNLSTLGNTCQDIERNTSSLLHESMENLGFIHGNTSHANDQLDNILSELSPLDKIEKTVEKLHSEVCSLQMLVANISRSR